MLKTSIQNIPDVLIYEMDGDKPVYYQGYRQAIENPQLIEKLRASVFYKP